MRRARMMRAGRWSCTAEMLARTSRPRPLDATRADPNPACCFARIAGEFGNVGSSFDHPRHRGRDRILRRSRLYAGPGIVEPGHAFSQIVRSPVSTLCSRLAASTGNGPNEGNGWKPFRERPALAYRAASKPARSRALRGFAEAPLLEQLPPMFSSETGWQDSSLADRAELTATTYATGRSALQPPRPGSAKRFRSAKVLHLLWADEGLRVPALRSSPSPESASRTAWRRLPNFERRLRETVPIALVSAVRLCPPIGHVPEYGLRPMAA